MSGARALRGLGLWPPQTARAPLAKPSTWAVGLAALAVALQLTVSSNLLLLLGINYTNEGGNPLIKFHPATYLACLALAVRLFSGARPLRTIEQLVLRFPLPTLFMAMMSVCIAWVVINIGVGGAAVYVESYVSAGVLLLVLADARAEQRRLLGYMMLSLFVLNGAIASVETVVRHTLLPQFLAHGQIYIDVDYEFRGMALYDHALTGGMMTEMGLLLLVAMRPPLKLGVLLALPMIVGMISFGGRTSILVCSLTILGIGGFFMGRRLLDRTLRPFVIVTALGGVGAVVALLTYLVGETSIGVRLAGKMSFDDDSSVSRSVEWLMPGLMNLNEFLFGISVDREVEYIYQLGLTYPFLIVENFWLVAFINLGAFGFVFYVTGFGALLVDLWRRAPLFGRAILVTTILVASTSNSLGRKSNVLFVMTAAVVATTAFARTKPERASLAHRAPRGSMVPSPVGRGLVPAIMVDYGEPYEEPPFGEPRDAPALRSWGVVLRPGTRLPAEDAAKPASPPPQPGPGGLSRGPTSPDRALRPLRLTAAAPR